MYVYHLYIYKKIKIKINKNIIIRSSSETTYFSLVIYASLVDRKVQSTTDAQNQVDNW